MIIPLKHIRDMARHRPPGYEADVLEHGSICGEDVVLSDSDYQKLCRKYRPTMPTFHELVGNFTGAVAGWVKAGFPVVSNDTFTDRMETCQQCEYWSGNRCGKCGCFAMKLWMASEKCPVGKWS